MKSYKILRHFLHKGVVLFAGALAEMTDEEAKFLVRTGRLEEATEVELEDMTKDALLKLAQEKGLEVKPTMKKGDLIDLLRLEG
jgi:hypothetical protein